MSYSRNVGRVGVLAVALGIGSVAGGYGIAAADTDHAVNETASPAADSGKSAAASGPRRHSPKPAGGEAARRLVGSTPTLTIAPSRPDVRPPNTEAPDFPAANSTALTPATTATIPSGLPATMRAVSPRAAVPAAAPSTAFDVPAKPAQTYEKQNPPLPAVAAPQAAAASGVVESLLAPLHGSDAPVESPVSWVMLAAARREGNEAQAASPTAAVVAAQTGAPTFGEILQYTFFNKASTAHPTQAPGQSVSGVVTGDLNASSPTVAVLTYELASVPNNGTVELGEDGTYTFTPDANLLHNGGSALFAVTIDNGSAYRLTGLPGTIQGILHSLAQAVGLSAPDTMAVMVAVTIAGTNPPPPNTAPIAEIVSIGSPDPSTGKIIGTVAVSDADGDEITYSVPTSTAKGDITFASDGTFTYTPNAAARNAAANPNATAAEKTDTFTVTFTDGRGGATNLPIAVTISPKAIVVVAAEFSSLFLSTAEGNSGITTVPLTVTLSAPSTETVTVTYKTEARGLSPLATPGQDFVAETGTLVFAPGQTQATLPFKIYGDTTYEPDEYVHAELTGATNAILSLDGNTSHYFTIRNDDVSPVPAVTFSSVFLSTAEGNSGITTVPLIVTLSSPSTETVTVTYKTEARGLSPLATPGQDFVAETGTLVFAPGQTQATLPFKIYGDTTYEPDEYVHAELTGATNAILSLDGNTSHYFTIRNDDVSPVPAVTFSSVFLSTAEGNSGITTVPLIVTLSSPSTETVTVTYKTEARGLSPLATPGQDFVAETGTLVFAPGQTQATLPFKIYGDTTYEPDEYVHAELTGATNAILSLDGTTSHYFTIRNDDPVQASV